MKALIEGYKDKTFSPVEITKIYLNRIQTSQSSLNAFITITEELALKQAEIAEKQIMYGLDLGKLHGVPVSYKDLIYTKGIKTTSGSQIDKDFIPKENAFVVKKLNKEGALNLGKTNMYEYAFDIRSDNPFYGAVKNPWDLTRMAGGSSSGAGVAIASNLSMGTIGTDTGGSIRVPAACTGIIGLKPTHNLIDNSGIMPISWTLDHAGPMTRNVSDLALMMEALTGLPYEKNCIFDVRGLRIGVPKTYIGNLVDQEIMSLYNKALDTLEKLGAILIEIDMNFVKDTVNIIHTIAQAEGGYVHEKRMNTSMNLYSNPVRAALESSHSITFLDYMKAMKKRETLIFHMNQLFKQVDVIATPTQPVPATKFGVDEVTFLKGEKEILYDCITRFTRLLDITGHPAISLPSGMTSEVLPAGLQLIAGYHKEGTLIQTAYTFEQESLAEFYQQRNVVSSIHTNGGF